MWLEELSENTQHLSMSIAMLKEEIVDVIVRLNQAVRQRLSEHCQTYHKVPVT